MIPLGTTTTASSAGRSSGPSRTPWEPAGSRTTTRCGSVPPAPTTSGIGLAGLLLRLNLREVIEPLSTHRLHHHPTPALLRRGLGVGLVGHPTWQTGFGRVGWGWVMLDAAPNSYTRPVGAEGLEPPTPSL